MMYLLDTNVVSELRKVRLGKADKQVSAWVGKIDASNLFVSVITLMELEMGVLAIERRDAQQGKLLRQWLDERVVPEFEERTISIDTTIAQRCARLHIRDRQGERDALIAATALVHGMTVATRNINDFLPSQVACVNPWLPPKRTRT
ncbi:MAG: type II toxin-antitoxin system VapC family toxin [Burkholderiaceae bacterium]